MTLEESVKMAAELLADNKLTVEEIAAKTGLTVNTVNEIAEQQENSDIGDDDFGCCGNVL